MTANAQHRTSGPAAASAADWALLTALIALGGSSFTFIHIALETAPPAVVTVGRLWIAAFALYGAMRAKGRKFPSVFVRIHSGWGVHRLWLSMAAVGMVGYCLPFLIFPWAQQFVDSGLAGVYMAFMPLWTLGLAYFFADEKMTPQKLVGFAMGFVGVIILMGPEAVKGVGSGDMLAQAALLLATLLYAAAAVLSRRAPPARPRVYTAGVVLCGAIFATPALLFSPFDPQAWSLKSIVSIIVLGIGPTGIAGIVIIMLIRRAGAGFMALANYLVPIWAVFLGTVLFGEQLELSTLIALAVILTGVAISQRKGRPVVETGDAMAAGLVEISADKEPAS